MEPLTGGRAWCSRASGPATNITRTAMEGDLILGSMSSKQTAATEFTIQVRQDSYINAIIAMRPSASGASRRLPRAMQPGGSLQKRLEVATSKIRRADIKE